MGLVHGVFYNDLSVKTVISKGHPHIELLNLDGTVCKPDPPTISGPDFYFGGVPAGSYRIHAWSDAPGSSGHPRLDKVEQPFSTDTAGNTPPIPYHADVPGPYILFGHTCYILVKITLPPGSSLDDVDVARTNGGGVVFGKIPDSDANYILIQSLERDETYELIVSCGGFTSGKIIKAAGDGYSREMDLSFL